MLSADIFSARRILPSEPLSMPNVSNLQACFRCDLDRSTRARFWLGCVACAAAVSAIPDLLVASSILEQLGCTGQPVLSECFVFILMLACTSQILMA